MSLSFQWHFKLVHLQKSLSPDADYNQATPWSPDRGQAGDNDLVLQTRGRWGWALRSSGLEGACTTCALLPTPPPHTTHTGRVQRGKLKLTGKQNDGPGSHRWDRPGESRLPALWLPAQGSEPSRVASENAQGTVLRVAPSGSHWVLLHKPRCPQCSRPNCSRRPPLREQGRTGRSPLTLLSASWQEETWQILMSRPRLPEFSWPVPFLYLHEQAWSRPCNPSCGLFLFFRR